MSTNFIPRDNSIPALKSYRPNSTLHPFPRANALIGEAGPEHLTHRDNVFSRPDGMLAFTQSIVVNKPTLVQVDQDTVVVPAARARRQGNVFTFHPYTLGRGRTTWQGLMLLKEGFWLPGRPVGTRIETASQVDPSRKIEARFRVADLNEPIASNLPTGEVNPAYDPMLQPRQRDRAASQAQIEGIAKRLEPAALLNPATSWAEGPPLVGPEGMVESGNGRILALRRAAELNPAGFAAYREQLLAQAQTLGLKPEEIRQMERPVLVRERLTPLNLDERLRFVAEANASGAARMGAAEQARADARLVPPHLFTNLQIAESDQALAEVLAKKANAEVARGFVQQLPETERAALMTREGTLSAEGVSRLERAMFAYAMPGQSGERLSRLVFEEGEAIGRVGAGIKMALPHLGQMESQIQAGHRKGEYGIGNDLSLVVEKMRDVQARGISINDYLGQHKMFAELTPFQEQLMSQLDERRHSARQVAELLGAYANAVERTPSPGQVDMFGGQQDMGISKEGLLRTALKSVGSEWKELVQSAQGPQDAPDLPHLAEKPEPKGAMLVEPTRNPAGQEVDDLVRQYLPDWQPPWMAQGEAQATSVSAYVEPTQEKPVPQVPIAAGGGGGNKPPKQPPVALQEPPEEPERRPKYKPIQPLIPRDNQRSRRFRNSPAFAFNASNASGIYSPQPRGRFAVPFNPLASEGAQRRAQRLQNEFPFAQDEAGQWVNVHTGLPADQRQLESAFRSRREALQAQGDVAAAERLQAGEYVPGDLTRIGEAEGDTRLAGTILRNIRDENLGQARRQGQAMARARIADDAGAGGVFADVKEARALIGQQRSARQEWQGLNIQHRQALAAGDFGRARDLESRMNSLRDNITAWSDQIKAVQPAMKEHANLLTSQNKNLDAELKQLQATNKAREALRTRLEAQAKHHEPGSPEATINAQQRARLERDITGRQSRIESLVSQREANRAMRAELTGIAPLAAPRMATGAPPSFWQESRGILRRAFDPQSLFYTMSNLDQLRYSAWLPLMQARDAYQQSQFTRGQMLYSLGVGSMGEVVGRDRANQAARADAWTKVGEGVNRTLQPIDDFITREIRGYQGEEGQDVFSTLGQVGTYGAAGLSTMLIARGLGVDRLAWAGAKAVGRASGMAPAARAAAGVGSKLLGGLGRFAGLAMAPVEGLRQGFGIYDMMRGESFRPFGIDTGLRPFGEEGLRLEEKGGYWDIGARQDSGFTTYRKLAAAELGLLARHAPVVGLNSLQSLEKAGLLPEGTAAGLGEKTSRFLSTIVGEEPHPAGRPTKQDPLPVSIERITHPEDLVKALGQASARAAGMPLTQYQFSEDQLRQVTKEFAESSGLDFTQLRDMRGQGYQVLERAVTMAVKSGLPPEQLVSYFAKAPAAAGYLPGSRASLPFLDYLSQGQGLTDLSNRMQSLQAVSREAQFAGFNPAQQVGIAGRWQELAQEQGEFRANRELSRLVGGNVYDYSDLARRSGHPDLAIVDEQGRPMHQAETWAIEDRQREWQTATQLGVQNPAGQWQGGRQQQELDWQQQRLDLEERFWDFRQKRREEDYQFQVRQFDITRQQMEYAIDREEKVATMQAKYQERQFAINKQIFSLQTQWQREDFARQEQRLETQRGWQIEDLGANRQQFELQAGWALEDMQRNLRYATGRERLDVRRQMERQEIMNNLKRDQMGRDETKAATQYGWQVEDLETAKARFEELRPLQEEQMRLGYEYFQQQKQLAEEDQARRKEMMQEQLRLMTDQHNAWLTNYDFETALLNEQHGLETKMAQDKMEWARQDLEEARRRSEEEAQILKWQRQAIENQQKFNMVQTLGWDDATIKAKDLLDIQKEMVKQAQQWADLIGSNKPTAASGNSNTLDTGNPIRPEKTFAEGGPTFQPTLGLLSEYGQEEHVVPSQGALVLREPGVEEGIREMVVLLQTISMLLSQQQQNGKTIDLEGIILGVVARQFDQVYRR